MVFKINVSHNGKTAKFETDSEELIDKAIGEKLEGKELSKDLAGYELEITGTSDKAGFPGLKHITGSNLRKVLLKKGIGMKKTKAGLILRKTARGNLISQDIVQINTKVLKEGDKKFAEFLIRKEENKE